MKKIVGLLVLISTLSGCSATGPIFKHLDAISENTATIYIYRPWLSFNMGGWPNIYIDGEEKFSLKNNGYGVIYLKPGNHEIKAEGSMLFTNWYPGPASFSMDYEAGEEYYVRVMPELRDTMFVGNVVAISGSAQISIIPKNEAMVEIAETKKVY